MGAYLSQPITDKVTEAGANSALEYAVAAMQGWRTEMEDAHVCALDIEKETSIFGVFDGHGGKEVARFVALHLVEELLSTKGFQEADFPLGLKEAYLSLDALIRSEKSRSELLKLSAVQKTEEEKTLERVIQVDHLPKLLRDAISASRLERDAQSESHGSESDVTEFDTEDADSSFHEERARAENVGSFPIALSDTSSSSGSEMDEIVEEEPPREVTTTITPPLIAEPRQMGADEGCSNAVEDSEPFVPLEPSVPMEPAVAVSGNEAEATEQPRLVFNTSDSTDSTECRSSEDNGAHGADITTPVASDTPTAKVELGSNHEKIEPLPDNCVFENARARKSHKVGQKSHERSGSVMGGLLSFVCPFACLRSTELVPEEDPVLSPSYSSVTTSAPSSSSPVAAENREDPAEDWVEQPKTPNPEETETEEPILESREEISAPAIVTETKEEKEITNGRDVTVAGCTAVVAVIAGETLFVANAGDSRCVLCHEGIALPMSRDHKPTDPEEYVRIKNAGGFVSDGRVNGCLNLSRALGDMEYKKSPHLAPEEYMITANPDIKSMDLQSGDHFLILACDGIWDVLSDQEACDFVLSRLQQKHSLESISAELCDFCLAEDAEGSGEGCDNMTAMIVMLKQFANDPVRQHH